MSSELPVDEKAVFNAARKIADADAREQYLVSACGDDQETLQRVRELLSAHSTKETFLESPAVIMEATQLLSVTEKSGDTIGPYKLLQQLGEGGSLPTNFTNTGGRREKAPAWIPPGIRAVPVDSETQSHCSVARRAIANHKATGRDERRRLDRRLWL